MKTILSIICAILGLLAAATQPAGTTQPAGEKIVKPSGLTIIITEKGAGVKDGDTASILYTGKLTDGKVFDSTAMHGDEPITVKIGAGQVIKGWEEGLLGMQVGEKRHLIIPPDLGFGAAGRGDRVPPNATLEFDVELVGLTRAP